MQHMARFQGREPRHKVALRGTSLIEVLVALVVISIALLGGVALQLRALQLDQSSQWRDQAIVLAADLAERMEANKAAVTVDGAYTVPQTSVVPLSGPACSTLCTAAEVAALDLYQWQVAVAGLLPQSTWAVRQTASGNPSTYEITLQWADGRGGPSVGKSTQVMSSYVATRTVYLP